MPQKAQRRKPSAKKKNQAEVNFIKPADIKRDMFVKEYIIDLNATQAAVRAGYSKKTARQQGYRLLTNDYIQKKLQKLIEERSVRTRIDAETVFQECARIALADIGPAFNDDGSIKDYNAPRI